MYDLTVEELLGIDGGYDWASIGWGLACVIGGTVIYGVAITAGAILGGPAGAATVAKGLSGAYTLALITGSLMIVDGIAK